MLIKDKTDCCGCTACESVCAHKAITMQPDELGFLYPKIDFELCVDCGLCEKVCQFKKNYNRGDNYATPKVYAARHKKLNELAESQTGAAFFAFSEKILDEGGVVYGVIFAEDFHVVHSRTETKEKRDHMRTSKYVQSDIRGIFSLVKDDLRAGRTVLFTGTPCQVAGMLAATPPQLHKYLITIDLVCHAVPSPAVWESYIAWLQKKYQEKILIAKHRDKKFGWASCSETFCFATRKITRHTYDRMYFSHIITRESCSNCPYTNINRVGDITIGDFWGWKKVSKEFDDNQGVSLVLVNSEKGTTFFDSIRCQIHCVESNTTDCLQPQLISPIKLHPKRDAFIKDYTKYGFKYVGEKYGDMGWRHQILRVVKKMNQIKDKYFK